MELRKVYLGSISGKLTCSEVMQLLMEQPTKPVGRKIESHAHMHTMEGFTPAADGFGGSAFSLRRKQHHYQNPTHLYPAGSEEDRGRLVHEHDDPYDADASYGGVFQDADRLPPNREYASRTGLDTLPKIPGPTTYTVYRKVARSKPVPEVKGSMAQVNLLPTDQYLTDKGGQIRFKENRPPALAPEVKASPAHTMFTDSESMVMHLTAALRSGAGRIVLHHLLRHVGAGGADTVGIFSHSAVRAVNAADQTVNNQMVERTLEVDQTQPRAQDTGFYPATGTVLTALSGIDHAVVILGHSAAGHLNVITCYPSKQSTGATIGTATGANEDIAELRIGQHTKVPQNSPISLSW
jgi:hypothetical protein